MKRGMKKIAALFTAVIMVFGMCLTAFAAESQTHKITVNGGDNSLAGVTFNAYKLFDITTSSEKGQYGYTPTDDFEAWLTEQANKSTENSTESTYDYVKEQMETAATAQTFLESLQRKISASSLVAAATVVGTVGQNSVELKNLTAGYYVIYPGVTGGNLNFSPMAANVVNTDVDVYVKVSEPTIDKEVGADGNDKDWADAQIGTKVPFKVTVQVPNTTGMDMDSYVFQVVDIMSDGLTFNETDVEIKIGEMTLTKDTDYTVTPVFQGDDTKIRFDFVMEKDDGKKDLSDNLKNNIGKNMTISYTATLNDKAVVENPETNSAALEYTNQSGTTVEGDKVPTDETKVYTYEYDFVKKAENKDGKALSGAEFEVYQSDKKMKINFVKGDSKGYRVADADELNYATLTTDTQGMLHIYGLKAGTYYLKETKAPDGYNKLKDMIKFTITNNNNNGSQIGTMELTVVNKSGSLLPETGGTGSVLFAVIGGLVILGGGFVLLRGRKRPEA